MDVQPNLVDENNPEKWLELHKQVVNRYLHAYIEKWKFFGILKLVHFTFLETNIKMYKCLMYKLLLFL